MGETPGNEIAITVTGLKPNHFYNIRVVAIGPNNFQAASHTIRLRTFGNDGKPYLGNARLPANFVGDDQLRVSRGEDCNGSDGSAPTFAAAAVEAAPVLEGSATASRDATNTSQGQRRNTVGRRHSPSVASADQPSVKPSGSETPEPSLDELNQKFQEIRREINETANQIATEDDEFQLQEEELKREKETKKSSLKEKEEQTAQLKALIRTTMEQMRAAEKEKLKKEQQLKDKDKKKSKVRDNITKLEKETDRMRKECQGFHAQKVKLQEQRDTDVQALDEKHEKLQEELNELEADLSNKGKLLNEMKEARKHLPGADNEQSRERDETLKRDWEMSRAQLHNQLVAETKAGHQLDAHYNTIIEQLNMYQQSAFYNQPDTSALDLENTTANQSKRLSHNSNDVNVSPSVQFALSEAPNQGPPGLSRSPFVPVLIMPETGHEAQTEDDLRSAGGALSPSAHAYLPSGIIDFEASEPKQPQTPQLPEHSARDDDPQSPASSSMFSSPHGSSLNLPFPQYQDGADKLSINPPPAASPPSTLRLSSLLAGFQRSRNAKTTDEGGPPIGSLRPGQSQSFPRGTDEAEILGSRRRMSFSFKNHRNSTGPDGTSGLGSAGSKMLSRRLNPFGSSSSAVFDRDPDASRPPSIASSDLPRPSTDSGSIWGVPGDIGNLNKNRLWSAEGRWPSRSGSRRPSIHGSPAALTTSLASADDEILYDTELMDPQTSPSQVGVIGSRPPGLTKSISQRLNPNAPTFMGLFGKIKDKDKEKDKSRDKMRDAKGKGKEGAPPLPELSPTIAPGDDSPSDSRVSRDTFSVHTQTSISESHESLPLDASSSNTQLDLSGSLPRETESVNGIRKLLRKGSSSKFSSLSSRLGKDSGLFKKGPGSATNSDRNTSADHRSSIGDLEELGEDLRGLDSLTGSPSLGPAKSKESKESRMSNWRFKMKKGKETPSKEKESMDLDRPMGEE